MPSKPVGVTRSTPVHTIQCRKCRKSVDSAGKAVDGSVDSVDGSAYKNWGCLHYITH